MAKTGPTQEHTDQAECIMRLIDTAANQAQGIRTVATYLAHLQNQRMEFRTWRPGTVDIGKWTSNHTEREGVRITLYDESSSTQTIEIDMGVEHFARAIMGSGRQECRFALGAVDLVGYTREHKNEVIFVPDKLPRDKRTGAVVINDPLVVKALAPYRVDGWRPYHPDMTNSHRRVQRSPSELYHLAAKAGLDELAEAEPVKGAAYEVGFHRYLDDTGKPWEPRS